MRCSGSVVLAAASSLLVTLTLAPAVAAVPGDEHWDGRFYVKGLSEPATCAAVDSHGDLWVGGSFRSADDLVVNQIARWDGSAWHALGSGFNGTVKAIAFDASGDVYAGGSFTDAGGDPDADRVAVWTGSSWSSLGGSHTGLSAAVEALAIDASGHL